MASPPGRKPNSVYRRREHLIRDELDRLIAALKTNRHGHRDHMIGLVTFLHALRVSELIDLRWDDISRFAINKMIETAGRKAKIGFPVHPHMLSP